MIGPTGVGKTEIARRLASLAGAPFVKVEATKYTEVGYVGRDVESMVRDLAEAAVRMVTDERAADVEEAADAAAVERVDRPAASRDARARAAAGQPVRRLAGLDLRQRVQRSSSSRRSRSSRDAARCPTTRRAGVRETAALGRAARLLRRAHRRDRGRGGGAAAAGHAGRRRAGRHGRDGRRRHGRDARRPAAQEARAEEGHRGRGAPHLRPAGSRQADRRRTRSSARRCGAPPSTASSSSTRSTRSPAAAASAAGPDVSREGVQRDILPIVEGSTVHTKYGPLSTDHVLFIAAGAFHVAKPSDLIPELQGRFPVRVELTSLTAADFEIDPHPARERADRPVQGAARRRRRRARGHRRRDRRDRPHRHPGQRADREHRRAPAAHGAGAGARRDRLPRARGRRHDHDRRRLRARAAGLGGRQRRPVELHLVAGGRWGQPGSSDEAIRNAAPSALLSAVQRPPPRSGCRCARRAAR